MHRSTVLNCSQKTAAILFIFVGSLFTFTGCAQLYKFLGLTEQQTQEQISEDQKTIIRTVTQVRTTAAEILTTLIAAAGTIATGFLAKWLHTERKITKAVITGVEDNPTGNVKESIEAKATALGVQPKLHARVKALT